MDERHQLPTRTINATLNGQRLLIYRTLTEPPFYVHKVLHNKTIYTNNQRVTVNKLYITI